MTIYAPQGYETKQDGPRSRAKWAWRVLNNPSITKGHVAYTPSSNAMCIYTSAIGDNLDEHTLAAVNRVASQCVSLDRPGAELELQEWHPTHEPARLRSRASRQDKENENCPDRKLAVYVKPPALASLYHSVYSVGSGMTYYGDHAVESHLFINKSPGVTVPVAAADKVLAVTLHDDGSCLVTTLRLASDDSTELVRISLGAKESGFRMFENMKATTSRGFADFGGALMYWRAAQLELEKENNGYVFTLVMYKKTVPQQQHWDWIDSISANLKVKSIREVQVFRYRYLFIRTGDDEAFRDMAEHNGRSMLMARNLHHVWYEYPHVSNIT